MFHHIYDIMADQVPQRERDKPTRPAAPPSLDPYFGFEVRAKTCARFIAHHFGIFAPPIGVEPLDRLIARVSHRTRYRSSTTFAALYLLGFLKERFLDQVVSDSRVSCHRLFLAAFMVASKSIHDDTYSTRSFAELANGVATVSEINAMEREMLQFLDWKVNVPNQVVEEFRWMVERDFVGAGPYPTYRYAAPGAKGAPLQIPTAILSESPVSGALTTGPAPPSAFLPPQPTVSYPPSRAELPAPKRRATTSDNVPDMQQVYRSAVSIAAPSAGPRRAMTYPPPPQPAVTAPVANPYMLSADPNQMASHPFPSHVQPIVCSSGIAVPTLDKGWLVVPTGGPSIIW